MTCMKCDARRVVERLELDEGPHLIERPARINLEDMREAQAWKQVRKRVVRVVKPSGEVRN